MRPFAGGLGREEGGSGRWRGRSAVGDGFDLGRGGPGRGGALVRPFAGGLGREEGGSGRWRGRSAVGGGFDLGRGGPGRGRARATSR